VSQSLIVKLKPKLLKFSAAIVSVAVLGGYAYVKAHPLIFNESFFSHAHCIVIADTIVHGYAEEHGGRFPSSTNGYGDALLLIVAEDPGSAIFLTGPCYNEKSFLNAIKSGGHLAESDCGRVYVQGLTVSNNPDIVILFDKIPTPGGDHCHGVDRFKMPLAREVLLIGGHDYVEEANWPQYSSNQVELLVQAGIPRKKAEELYSLHGR
jgi:hypothetical protein